jgi:hypothetical protein
MLFGSNAYLTVTGERRPFALLALDLTGFAIATSLFVTFAWGFHTARAWWRLPSPRLWVACIALGLLTAVGAFLLTQYGRLPSRP